MNTGASYLYRHFDSTGSLLYVGISLSAITRLQQHKKSRWFKDICKTTIESFDTREQAKNAERNAITTENPRFNIQNKQRGGIMQTAEASAIKAILNTKEAADYLTLKPATLEAWRCRGGGPVFVKLGKACRYRKEDLDAFLSKHTFASTSAIDK
jgi:hypothetical protein